MIKFKEGDKVKVIDSDDLIRKYRVGDVAEIVSVNPTDITIKMYDGITQYIIPKKIELVDIKPMTATEVVFTAKENEPVLLEPMPEPIPKYYIFSCITMSSLCVVLVDIKDTLIEAVEVKRKHLKHISNRDRTVKIIKGVRLYDLG